MILLNIGLCYLLNCNHNCINADIEVNFLHILHECICFVHTYCPWVLHGNFWYSMYNLLSSTCYICIHIWNLDIWHSCTKQGESTEATVQ